MPTTSSVNPFSALNPQTTSTGSGSTGGAAPAIDTNAFLKLLIAQLSNQDPTQPVQGTEFVTQLAQFAQVEQAQSQSGKLDLLSTQLTGIANNEATQLVGRHVTVHGNGMTFDGTTATTSNVTLGGAAQSVTATIQDSTGHTVRTLQLGAHGTGALSVTWDGRNDAGQRAPSGTYSVQVAATDSTGAAVSVSQNVSGTVQSVNYSAGYPQLVLDNGATVSMSDIVSVDSSISLAH